jgi:polysaccharide export outer membrane protein
MQIKYRNLGLALVLLASSCSSPKKTIYFKTDDKAITSTEIVEGQPRPELIISPDDILAINVSSEDAFSQKDPLGVFSEGGVPYNISAQGNGGGVVKGYLVNQEGDIDFPMIGKIHLSGLTPIQARDLVAQKLVRFIKSPIVETRLLNYKINMIGEIGRVGPIMAPNHKLNILEAIAAAGDIPITGRKDNVLIIREKNGKQEFGRVNLNSKSIFTSPYYYMQKNDIVYVEPNRIKRQQTNEFLMFYLPTITGLLSAALSVYGIVQLAKNTK